MEELLAWFAIELIFFGIFGWRSKRERTLAVANIVLFCAAIFAVYTDHVTLAGVLGLVIVVLIVWKISIHENVPRPRTKKMNPDPGHDRVSSTGATTRPTAIP